MHRQVVDEQPREGQVVEVVEGGRAEEHDDVPLGHEHHLALEVEARVALLAQEAGPAQVAVASIVLVHVIREGSLALGENDYILAERTR